jgi:hypothetical protein
MLHKAKQPEKSQASNCKNISIYLFKKTNIMGNLLYLIAIILIIGWAVGFFMFSLGAFIHLLLIFAIIAILFRLIRGDRAV